MHEVEIEVVQLQLRERLGQRRAAAGGVALPRVVCLEELADHKQLLALDYALSNQLLDRLADLGLVAATISLSTTIPQNYVELPALAHLYQVAGGDRWHEVRCSRGAGCGVRVDQPGCRSRRRSR